MGCWDLLFRTGCIPPGITENLKSRFILSALHHRKTWSLCIIWEYSDPKLLKWFTEEYKEQVKGKLEMGKSCVRFKKFDEIPMKLIGELASKMTAKEWIGIYERNIKR